MLNIVLLGLVSFFSDISSEMVYPLIPLYLTGAFGATPALVGIIEGIAESLADGQRQLADFIFENRPVRLGLDQQIAKSAHGC